MYNSLINKIYNIIFINDSGEKINNIANSDTKIGDLFIFL